VSSSETTFFFAPPEGIESAFVTLPPEEAHHASRVLRLTVGDEVLVVDGQGGWYRVELEECHPRGVRGRIVERRLGVGEPLVYVHLAVAGLKSRSRMDMLLEKSTELGVSRITLLETRQSERARVDSSRAVRVMRAAMKQCKRSRVPLLEGPVGWDEFLSRAHPDRRLVCHQSPGRAPAVRLIPPAAHDVVLAVGPEGGFTEEEVQRATSAGFETLDLGARRLRTETACLVACTMVLFDIK